MLMLPSSGKTEKEPLGSEIEQLKAIENPAEIKALDDSIQYAIEERKLQPKFWFGAWLLQAAVEAGPSASVSK